MCEHIEFDKFQRELDYAVHLVAKEKIAWCKRKLAFVKPNSNEAKRLRRTINNYKWYLK